MNDNIQIKYFQAACENKYKQNILKAGFLRLIKRMAQTLEDMKAQTKVSLEKNQSQEVI